MFKKYIILAFLALMSQNTRTMEQAIIDGNFSYVQKNINSLEAEQKEIYLDVANKQLTLATNQSKSWVPNKWDAATLATGIILSHFGYENLKNTFKSHKKYTLGYGYIAGKFIQDINEIRQLKDLHALSQEELDKDIKNPYSYIGAQKRAFIDAPMREGMAESKMAISSAVLAVFLLQRAYGAHYKNLDLKNRLAIKQLIENAKIIGQDSQEEKIAQKTLKEEFNDIIDSTKKMGMNLRNNATQTLNKFKTKFEQYRNVR